jgi:hypothetical protein
MSGINETSGRRAAQECAACGCLLAQVGGRRIVASASVAVVVCEANKRLPLHQGEHVVDVNRNGERVRLLLRGPIWNADATERAMRQTLAGRTPWICQRCAGRLCSLYGAPEGYIGGTDMIQDDGGRLVYQYSPPPTQAD